MRRNIKLIIEYDGTNFYGWQEQADKITIQSTLKKTILQITGEDVIVYGAGRTDTGVHARGQVANFYTEHPMPDFAFAKAMNSLLPRDVCILESKSVELDFHSQFWAKGKAYSYNILNRTERPAIFRNYYHWVWHKLDVSKMQQAAQCLLGEHDFTSFEASNSPRKSNIRIIYKLNISEENNMIRIFIEANGFLYHMVRNIAGTLILIGNGKWPPEKMNDILKAQNRKFAGATAPSQGLVLEYVRY